MRFLVFSFITFILSDSCFAQEVQNAISIIEKATITVENFGRAPAECKNCDVDVILDLSFYRDEPSNNFYDFSLSGGGLDPSYEQSQVQDGSGKRPTGFQFKMSGPNKLAPAPLDPAEKIERLWRFVSRNGSKRETYLAITDDAGSGYLSQLMETVIVLVPRKHRPHVEVVADELHVTLPTGEKVIYDKATRLIKSGVLSEGSIDTNSNRHQRKFIPLKYSGTGISIRVDKRGEDPRIMTPQATVTQQGQSCQVPAKDLWQSNTDFKFVDDESLVKYLNSKCSGKFKL